MAHVFISEAADRDVSNSFDRLRRVAGFKAADTFNETLKSLYRQLSRFPESGPLRPNLGVNVRIAPLPTHIAVYRYDAAYDAVNILRILHNRRDLDPTLLTGRP